MRKHRFSSRFRRPITFASLACLPLLLGPWLWLRFDSIHQRQRAESVIEGLKSFQFASATFFDVRDFAVAHGGTAVREFPPPKPPHHLQPAWDAKGKLSVLQVQSEPVCTVLDCIFEISIRTGLSRLPLEGRTPEILYARLPLLGIRSWIFDSILEVRGGKLLRSRTLVAEERDGEHQIRIRD